jgi:RND family efflux transporter MFP subunit
METAKKELERTEKLVEAGAIPRQRLDQAQNAYMLAQTQHESAVQSLNLIREGTRSEDISIAQEAVRQAQEAVRSAKAQKQLDVVLSDQVQSARANVQAAQAQVDIAREAISEAQIKAPFTGKISGRPAQPGTMVGAGAPVARIVGVQGVYFEGQVPEAQIAALEVGAPVQVTISALGNRLIGGAIAAISPAGADVGRSFSVRVQLGGNPVGVRPGMFARGVVQLRVVPSATVVPEKALVTRDGKTYVFVVEGTAAKRLLVEAGLRNNGNIEVRGVALGQQVVVQGQEALDDGTRVKVETGVSAVSEDGGQGA